MSMPDYAGRLTALQVEKANAKTPEEIAQVVHDANNLAFDILSFKEDAMRQQASQADIDKLQALQEAATRLAQ